MNMLAGIAGWGTYIPRFRISTREIARVWGDDPLRIRDLYLIEEKSVEFYDEDAVTMAVNAARTALRRAEIDPEHIDAVFVGTESKPYAVKPIASIITAALGLRLNVQSFDAEFACKAASDLIICMYGLLAARRVRAGIVVGSDASQGEPGEHLDYSASAGAVAFVLSSDKDKICAVIEDFYSCSSDTPDFWRRDGCPYPVHGEGFTGEPAYFRHIVEAARGLMQKLGLKPQDFDYAVFHQPNTRFPLRVASVLGFPVDKVRPGIVVNAVGNTYNASALLGLAKVLDVAKPGSRILVVTYGSGAGSNAFSIVTTDNITRKQSLAESLEQQINDKVLIDYSLYLRFRRLIRVLQ